MTTEAVIDDEVGSVFYLGFDLMLAEAPIRDGAVQIQESRLARNERDEPATACRHAAVRAALLQRLGPAFASDRDEEIERANVLAGSAGQDAPAIPDEEVRILTLHRDQPTQLG